MTQQDSPEASLRELLEVMAKLRGAEGCPWDREQTHRSLIPYLIEEAYELIDAIECGAPPALREELGDVLLQVVFHAQIAAEHGAFTFAEVAHGLTEKLRKRHPHVFGGKPLPSAEAVRQHWHERKMHGRDSVLDGISTGLPALQWAGKVGNRAALAGFEWNHAGEIFDKAHEELEELRRELGAQDDRSRAQAREEEFGDLLFALVQLGRWHDIDPEAALRRAVRKFSARFRHMERRLREQGSEPGDTIAAQWWALWDEAKRAESD